MPFEQIVCLDATGLTDEGDEGMAGIWAYIQNQIKEVQNAIGWVVQKAVAVGKRLRGMAGCFDLPHYRALYCYLHGL